jgi:hypothetical protein
LAWGPGGAIILIEGNAKCHHLKKYRQRDFAAGVYLSEAQKEYLFHTGKRGGELNQK